MSKKTYISLEANPLSVDVQIGGRLRTADFYGGLKHPIVIMPKFMTEEPEMQEALENYVAYGKSFVLLEEEKDELPEDALVPFPTTLEAKEWLNRVKKVPYNKMGTKEKVYKVAADLGLDLIIESE